MTSVKTRVPVLGTYKRHKLRLVEAARGLPGYVDSEPLRRKVEWLRSIGFSDGAIAAQAGVTVQMIALIRAGEHEMSQRRRAQLVMAVTHVPTAAQARTMVPALGVRRRLQALQAIGHSTRALAAALGVALNHIHQMKNVRQVMGETWLKVDDLYQQLSGTPGGSSRAISAARKKDYPAPLDWDGFDIDHPDHRPEVDTTEHDDIFVDEVLLARVLKGEYRGVVPSAERTALLDHAVDNGWSGPKVAAHLNMKKESGDRALVRHRKKRREAAA